MNLLQAKRLNAGYGGFQILFDIDFMWGSKEIVVIVGPNGSGKSTLLKSVFGLTKIYSGTIDFDRDSLVGLAPHEIARKGIAYLPQTENIFDPLKVRENLLMAGYVSQEGIDQRVSQSIETFPVLKGCINRKAGTLSGGERQMLAMAMALVREPKVILFDEPTANLAPKVAGEVLDKIIELRDTLGITVVIVEQSPKRALENGDKCHLLVGGKVAFAGRPEELLSHEELARLYLGIRTDN